MEFLNGKELDDFKHGRLVLDCPHAVIRAVGRAQIMAGAAVIDQDSYGELRLKGLFSEAQVVERISESERSRRGPWLVDARDSSGRVWHTLFLGADPRLNGGVVRSSLSSITTRRGGQTPRNADRATLVIVAPEARIPPGKGCSPLSPAREVHVSAAGLRFTFRNRDNTIEIDVQRTSGSLDGMAFKRIQWALELLLGRPVHYSAVCKKAQRWAELSLAARDNSPKRGLMSLYDVLYWDDNDGPWNLFCRHIEYMAADVRRDDAGARLLAAIHRRALLSVPDQWESASFLCEAVEQVVKVCFADEMDKPRVVTPDWDDAVALVAKSTLRPQTKDAVSEAMRHWGRKRPEDVLRRLEADGVLPPQATDYWAALREACLDDSRPWRHETVWSKVDSIVLDLYFRLLFRELGYEGPWRGFRELCEGRDDESECEEEDEPAGPTNAPE